MPRARHNLVIILPCNLLLGAGILTASPFRGPVMHAAILRCCLPAEHMRGTPSRLSPMLAACAATTLAAWTCSVRETASEVGPSLGPWPSEDTACSAAAECSLSSLFDLACHAFGSSSSKKAAELQ